MDIRILYYKKDVRSARQGYVDFELIYTPEKREIFRNVVHYKKDKNQWLGMQNVERDGKWLPRYERLPDIKPVLKEVIKKLMNFDQFIDAMQEEDKEDIGYTSF